MEGRTSVFSTRSVIVLLAIVVLILLVGSFLGGIWYNQRTAAKSHDAQGERRILHYVDPMNPAHTSDKPGPAPCGMPMEPVYEEQESGDSDLSGPSPAMTADTVKISLQKQQTIGVEVGTVEMAPYTHKVRTLGLVTPDGDRLYPLIAATEGWLQEVPGSTPGSMVKKDQVVAQIRVYDYDFFISQQRYLFDLGKAGRRRQPGASAAGARQPVLPRTPAPQPESGAQASGMDSTMQSEDSDPSDPEHDEDQHETAQHGLHPPGAMGTGPKQPVTRRPAAGYWNQAGNETRGYGVEFNLMGEDGILYANKSKLELLSRGVGEAQLDELARTGRYVTHVELRSPVTGFVLSRGVSPQQKVENGTECFRIADLSHVWIAADVYNIESQYIRPGMRATISLPQQSKTFEAVVSDVLPEFDAATRTLKVRLETDNPEYLLRPEMLVDVEFSIPLPAAVTVPQDAVFDSGLRKTVFVALGNGYFEPRSVQTGYRFGDRVEILQGLMPGEQIVVSGNFLIDSESRMKLAAAGIQGMLEKDPVCGLSVDSGKAGNDGLKADHGDSTYYFCSDQCMWRFEKEPEKHVGHMSEPAEGAVSPGIDVQSRFFKCMVCGMVMRKAKAEAGDFLSEYHGEKHYFCSTWCKQQFEKAPERFLPKEAGGGANGGASPKQGGKP